MSPDDALKVRNTYIILSSFMSIKFSENTIELYLCKGIHIEEDTYKKKQIN